MPPPCVASRFEAVAAARPYADKIRRTIGHIAQATAEYKHPFALERPVKRVLYIVVSSDRGLCGGLNMNLFRSVVRSVRDYREQGVEADFVVFGNKAATFFRRVGGKVLAQAVHLGDRPQLEQLGPIVTAVT